MSEKEVQRDVVNLYRKMGCVVYINSVPRHTMQTGAHPTQGIPDLEVFCERKGLTWRHETKTPTGKQSKAQAEYQRLTEKCKGTYVMGGVEEANQELRRNGIRVAA